MLKIVTFFYKLCNRLSIRFGKAAFELKTIKYHIEFGERDDDIYVVTYPKSGTTLMQMILYQLTTDGKVDFKHIYDVSPWTDNDVFRDIPPRDLPSPRIIKSHRYYKKFDKATKGRFIVVVRDGMDVAVSQYHQFKNYNNPDLEFDEFVSGFFSNKDNWFAFSRDWFKNKNKRNVLYVRYEDILNNFDESLKKVAGFINVEIDPKDLPRIKKHCSFEFMKQHEEKFGDEDPLKESRKKYDQFIRKGKRGEGKIYFNDKQKAKFEKQVKEYGL